VVSRSAQVAILRDVAGLEGLARIDWLITQVKDARSVAEVKVLGRELVRQVEAYRRIHPLRA
jgi:RNase adaptor protein for sRNA GlmZ degradation